MNSRILIAIGAFAAFLSVAAGAFGAHILKTRIDADMMTVFETAVRYQMYHSLALVFTGMLAGIYKSKIIHSAGLLFIFGIILFSGSLYILSLSGLKWFGAITPLGGLAFLGGWISLFIYFIKKTH